MDDDIERELAQLTGAPPGEWRADALVHNRANAVTGSIVRVTTGDWSAVLKVLRRHDPHAPAHWAASETPTDFNFWRREALAYETGLVERYAAGGIEAPGLLAGFARSPDEHALWLEDVAGTPGSAWTIDRHATAARSLGHAQARLAADPPDHDWLSRGFLRAYSTSRPADWSLLDDDAAWRQPLVRDTFPPDLRGRLVRMHAERDRWLDLMASLPRTLCHLDVWPNNLIARDATRTVLLDWSFVGDGAIGEDVGNLVPDCVFDLFVPATALARLDRAVFDAYVDGLRHGGWDGDPRLVRLATCASAIKYDWLAPVMLQAAATDEQLDYGGETPVDVHRRYTERGQALRFLTGWLDEARDLAAQIRV